VPAFCQVQYRKRVVEIVSHCPLCDHVRHFSAADDYYACRGDLTSPDCALGGCIPRERALAKALFSYYGRGEVRRLDIHEAAPSARGISKWLVRNCTGYVMSGYFPGKAFGSMIGPLRNEDLERQTFPDERFDIVLHLDVMEHLFHPFQALREIYRTLKPGGHCFFTAPTYPEMVKSRQVAQLRDDGTLAIEGKPEYHGNPQNEEEGALVTWRYGYDLPLLIARETEFDVEVRRWQAPGEAVMGYMTEVYVLTRRPSLGQPALTARWWAKLRKFF
jgi:SAM-dependent methyltransferase